MPADGGGSGNLQRGGNIIWSLDQSLQAKKVRISSENKK
jgi:hypothetical protein